MSKNDVYLTLEESLLPVLCDNTRLAHRVSRRIFDRHGIVSFIFGRNRFSDILDISSQTLKFPTTNESRLLAEELGTFAEKYPDMLCVLIPCSKDAEAFIKEFEQTLESRYIIASPSVFLSGAPFEKLVLSLEN